jgi:excisionase family DNA binding protein
MLTVKDVAERLRISADKVYDLVGAGEIEHHKIGGAIRITESQFAGYLESTRRPVREPTRRPLRRPMKYKHLRNF